MVKIEGVELPPCDEREILRYAGVKGKADENTQALLAECLKEGSFAPKVCYLELTKAELFTLLPSAKKSKGLVAALRGSERVLLFAATVGLEIDRLMLRYASVSPARALFFQAMGAERIEAVCDVLCQKRGYTGRRFSPGYGDFPLEAQREIFRLLTPEKIGLTLTDSLLMTPTKSVTAIVGETGSPQACGTCEKKDCTYRV